MHFWAECQQGGMPAKGGMLTATAEYALLFSCIRVHGRIRCRIMSLGLEWRTDNLRLALRRVP